MHSLLPLNRSVLLQDIEELFAQSLPDAEQLRTLWQPDLCPLPLLPFLAWSLSVDVWHDDWPEQYKRQVINAAFEVHRFKGTPYALQKALEGLEITAYLDEWWEQNPPRPPGTLTIKTQINDNLNANNSAVITRDRLHQLQTAIEQGCRASIHFSVELGVEIRRTIALCGAGGSIGYSAWEFT